MKKQITLLVIVLLFAAGPLMSQKQFYFGIAGTGLNSWITNQNNYGQPEMDYMITFGGGANANIGFDFNSHIGLKLEVGWQMLGQNYKDTRNEDNVNVNYTRNINLSYLEIPLLFKYKTSGEIARFYVDAGPQFNLLLSAKQKYYKMGETDNDIVYDLDGKPTLIGEETITDRFESIDILGRLDLGVDITLVENLFLNAGLSFGYGFLDINASNWRVKDSSGNYNPSHNIFVGFNVGINYCIPVGKKK
jgi:hypothetical protein